MKEICPYCMDKKEVKVIELKEKIPVKGSSFSVSTKALECRTCKTKFSTKKYPNVAIEKAFNLYREKNCLLLPEQIKSFRKELKLTQGELSKLFGFGGVTISRYESGAIQEKSHDNALRMGMTIDGMTTLLNQMKQLLSDKTIKNIETWIMEKKYIRIPSLKEKAKSVVQKSIIDFSGYKTLPRL